jgi:hypothetical protein
MPNKSQFPANSVGRLAFAMARASVWLLLCHRHRINFQSLSILFTHYCDPVHVFF